MLEVIWLLIINGMSSNKPGNSFLRKASYVFPVELLSNTKGPINLLPSTPHNTFTENLLLEVGYTCLMWIIMGPRMHIS